MMSNLTFRHNIFNFIQQFCIDFDRYFGQVYFKVDCFSFNVFWVGLKQTHCTSTVCLLFRVMKGNNMALLSIGDITAHYLSLSHIQQTTLKSSWQKYGKSL